MIKVRAKNFTLTDAIKTQAEDKFSKFNKFIDENETIDVLLDVDQNRHKASVYFNVEGEFFKAEESHDDLYAAIDLVVDTMQKQIRRHLDKLKAKGKESIRYGDLPVVEGELVANQKSKEIQENKKGEIVKRKMISTKPMFEEEAIEQMELLGHRSFIFYNADTETASMIYRRDDGDYGIIES